MAGLDHGPNSRSEADDAGAERRSRLGLVLFAGYFALYAGFVLLSAFAPDLMARPLPRGINLAISYGLGLILSAILLALVYGWLCQRIGATPPSERSGE